MATEDHSTASGNSNPAEKAIAPRFSLAETGTGKYGVHDSRLGRALSGGYDRKNDAEEAVVEANARHRLGLLSDDQPILRCADLLGDDEAVGPAELGAAELRSIVEKHGLWRKGEAGGEQANLRGSNLGGADLSGFDLRYADFREANLSEAKLRKADLQYADLSGAELSDADLRGADLRRADLRRAGFAGTDLREADLRESRIGGVELHRADLEGSIWTDVQAAGGAPLEVAATTTPLVIAYPTNAGWHNVISGQGHNPVTGGPDGEENGLVSLRMESGMSVHSERMTAREAVRLAHALLAAANALPERMW